MSVFLDSPTRGFGWKELSRKTSLGPPSTKKYIDARIKDGIVVERKVAGRKLYFANRENRLYRLYKRLDIILKLEKSGIIDFLNTKYGHPAIILFGSHSTGEATEDSDVDIAVFTESRRDADLKPFEKAIGRQTQLFKVSKADIRRMRKEGKSVYQGLFNGLVISGFAEVI